MAVLNSLSSFLSYASWWRLIDHGPENPELFDGINKLVEINWLDHIGVHTKCIARHHVSFLMGRREHDHRNHAKFLIGSNLLQHLQAINLRQFEIKQQDSRVPRRTRRKVAPTIQIIQGLFAVTSDNN